MLALFSICPPPNMQAEVAQYPTPAKKTLLNETKGNRPLKAGTHVKKKGKVLSWQHQRGSCDSSCASHACKADLEKGHFLIWCVCVCENVCVALQRSRCLPVEWLCCEGLTVNRISSWNLSAASYFRMLNSATVSASTHSPAHTICAKTLHTLASPSFF